jgi:hypothetical protein
MIAAVISRPPTRVMAALLFLLAAATPVPAQDWPTKTVRIVVPFGPGSTPDIVARLVADGLQQKYPISTFVVEDKPGASGNLGTNVVAKATPDGSTLGVSIGGPLAINTLFARLPYDPRKDIAPITQLITQPSVLAVNPDLGVNSVAELVALLKKNPGKYNFASIGNGSLSHLAMEAVAIKAGAKLVHVPVYQLSPGDHGGDPQRRADDLPSGDIGDATRNIGSSKTSRRLYRQALTLFARRADLEGSRHRRGSRRLERPDCTWWHTQADY